MMSKAAALMTSLAVITALPAVPAYAEPLGVGAPAGQGQLPSGVIAAYSLIAPKSAAESRLVARAVVARGDSCPRVNVVDTKGRKSRLKMDVRRPPATAASAFASVTVCSKGLPKGLASAQMRGHQIPAAMPKQVDSVAMVSDTGCRIRGSTIQDCSDPAAWPAAKISRRIAQQHPDVVLNVGDYFYREAACAADKQALCGGSPPPVTGMPFTDSDYGWLADVLLPMNPVLSVAPIVMLRGNHETCDRGGNGFFLFLDPRPDTAGLCAPLRIPGGLAAPDPATTPTWATTLKIGPQRKLRLALVDSAYGSDTGVTSWAATQRPTYERAESLTEPQDGQESWLMTHRPIFSVVTTQFAPPDNPLWTPWSSLDQTAAAQGLLDNYAMILSSHNHLAQFTQIPDEPPSLVLGNGGTLLDPTTGYGIPPHGPLANPDGTPIQPGITPYPTATKLWTDVRFGFAMATPGTKAGRWRIEHLDPSGEQFAECTLKGRVMDCASD